MSVPPVLLILALAAVAALTAGGMAMRSVSRIWLRHWVEQQLRGSHAAHVYLERPHRLIIAASSTVALILVLSGELLASDKDRADYEEEQVRRRTPNCHRKSAAEPLLGVVIGRDAAWRRLKQ